MTRTPLPRTWTTTTPPDGKGRVVHDRMCERGIGPIVEECHCASRAYQRDTQPLRPEPVEIPWGLFDWERGHPDTRGYHTGAGPAASSHR